jgi:hypothetical protein
MIKPNIVLINIKRYFTGISSVSFWHLPVKYDGTVDYRDPHFYYLDLSEKLKYRGHFDSGGIPMLDYKGNIGVRYNPCAVAQYGLGALYDFGKRGSKDSFAKFLSSAEWLSGNLKIISEENNLYLWLYDFDLDAYSIKAPWASALAQGQGISLLIRAYKITGDKKYALKAIQAFQSFLVGVEKGGVRRNLGEGVIFEEVPTNKPSCILDGFMFSLFGLMDLYIFHAEQKALEEFEKAYETLKRILPQYDMKFWSRADLYVNWPRMISSLFYHKLHIYQLDILYHITGNGIFKHYSYKWNKYLQNNLFKFTALIYKAMFKIFFY